MKIKKVFSSKINNHILNKEIANDQAVKLKQAHLGINLKDHVDYRLDRPTCVIPHGHTQEFGVSKQWQH